VRRIVLLGKRWILNYVPYLGDYYGHCDHPDTKNKQIKIRSGLKGEKKLEILIHEMLHSVFWHVDEEIITHAAKDIARVLWKEMNEFK
jgi:hypothetical protein